MPKSNVSDTDDHSLTSDDDDGSFISPSAAAEHAATHPAAASEGPAAPSTPGPSNNGIREEPAVEHTQSPPRPALGLAASRFRDTARKVMQLSRTSAALQGAPPGSEPGVNPRRQSAQAQWGHLNEKCQIEVMDYGGVMAKFQKFENDSFVKFLEEAGSTRPLWSKVRWISINGISWDVIRALSIKYDLHPLAIEDVLHTRRTAQSKADYYTRHLFIRVLDHTYIEDDDDEHEHDTPVTGQRSESPTRGVSEEATPADSINSDDDNSVKKPGKDTGKDIEQGLRKRKNSEKPVRVERFVGPTGERGREKALNLAKIERLKKGEKVNVRIQNLYIFLFRNGTVISIHQDASTPFGAAISHRLREPDTLLRASADPSLLVEGFLDLVVDNALQVIDAYHEKIVELEANTLIRPNMHAVRTLHIHSGELILLKRTLTPIKSLIYGIRRYDLDRCIAVAGSAQIDKSKVEGYMSHQSKVYMADVVDHMEYILTSLDMFAAVSENLISYTFNMISNDMNSSMRRLAIATIIFFPLTFLTGYFGQNFAIMHSVQDYSELLFWEIAIPVIFVVTIMFVWQDIHVFFMKRMLNKEASETIRNRH
ncbi:hypothetical protein BOTBODRAFT_173752 [Botryobasidium botryosum FD-172 SS1]|uniref:Uncharacterized protein n=1 Tax=Botryobasidium botryosum (strain FD-172 SS1) TaxID=930990 RepID=A0A067MIR4_BOTB1|nr:hypothetical protein BOTBODRAFT_173752 [Botryobasidium botryosum FD-172 SS1]